MKAHDEVCALIDAGKFHDAAQASQTKVKPITEANDALAEVIATNQNKNLADDLAGGAAAYAQARWSILGAADTGSGAGGG